MQWPFKHIFFKRIFSDVTSCCNEGADLQTRSIRLQASHQTALNIRILRLVLLAGEGQKQGLTILVTQRQESSVRDFQRHRHRDGFHVEQVGRHPGAPRGARPVPQCARLCRGRLRSQSAVWILTGLQQPVSKSNKKNIEDWRRRDFHTFLLKGMARRLTGSTIEISPENLGLWFH